MAPDLGLPNISRVAFAGDWHGNVPYAQMAIRLAATHGAQVILHTGDFGYRFTPDFLHQVDHTAKIAGVVVAFVDGNHEDFDWLLAQPVDEDGVRRLRPHVWHLPRALRWEWSGKRFLALGGAVSVDQYARTPGASWWPQEHLNYEEVVAAVSGGPADIMVTHDTPSGYEIPGLGSPDIWPAGLIKASNDHQRLLRYVVQEVKPSHLWHGHYHVPKYRRVLDGCTITGLHCEGYPLHENLDIWDLGLLSEGGFLEPLD